ncbi:MAG TPA: class I SAM-dependent methyltransferase [Terriglobales bacterium]|nr:class I SAM-dependent methyltransferase [Terriglobales bacterium]
MTQPNSQGGASVESLTQRHLVEETFHDEKAYQGAPPARTDFYPEWMADEHMEMLLRAAGPLTGKRVLDFGCGRGESGRIYAAHGASRVEGFDISGENIAIANKNAKRDGLEQRVSFRRLAAEEIDYPSGSFDVVIGKAILHHTDLEKTAWQLERVLVPGGVAVFLEPLAHNPFLNLFRRLTPSRRTPTEKPLSLDDLKVFRRHFGCVTYRGFYLFTLLSHFLLFVTGSRALFARSRALMRRWEEPVLVRLPRLQRYCWSAVVMFRKSQEAPLTGDWPAGQIRVELS